MFRAHLAIRAAVRLSCGLACGYDYDSADFATQVVEYVQGGDVKEDYLALGHWFNDPAAALGPPTVDTTGDGQSTGPPTQPVPVVPVYAAFRYFELVSVGEGGHLIVAFDHPVENDPRDPCGIDLIIFGNTLQDIGPEEFWENGDPNDTVVRTDDVWDEPSPVSVSQDGAAWHSFTYGPYADAFAPTLGRIYDEDNPDPSLGAWNQWWGEPTLPLLPLDPRRTASGVVRRLEPSDFVGLTVAEYAREYGYSAGGTGFDLADVGLDWILYVKIENPVGSGQTPEIDALADVDPDVAPPDFDCDTDVDRDDLDHLEACATGPALGPPASGCERADLDDDGDVDQADFGLLQRCLNEPDVPANPKCRQ